MVPARERFAGNRAELRGITIVLSSVCPHLAMAS